jgi:hypothetical protein
MGLALRDREHHSYGEYLTWPEEIRYELIEGRAYAMAPAPSVSHQEVVLALARQDKWRMPWRRRPAEYWWRLSMSGYPRPTRRMPRWIRWCSRTCW